jgi:hypothetical protein
MEWLNWRSVSGAAIGLLLSACENGGDSFSVLPVANSFHQDSQATNTKIDILWVIDNSRSMSPLQANLANNFHSFISTFMNKGYDFQLAVTASDAYLSHPAFRNNPQLSRFRDGTNTTGHTGVYVITPQTPDLENVFVTNAMQGDSSSGDERAFSSFTETLNNSLNAGFVRPDAFLAVVILSDEDDFSGNRRAEFGGNDHNYGASTLDPVSAYVSYLDNLTGSTPTHRKYNVSSAAVLDNTCLAQHRVAAPSAIIGRRYMDLATATEGSLVSICGNFGQDLLSLADHIIQLSTQFYLNRIPNPATIEVRVNGALVPEAATNPAEDGGWSYDATANSIVFQGSLYIPAQGSSIVVTFDPISLGG